MYDKYRIAKKWVEDVQNHANWAKETFERVILIPCVILIEACSVVRLRRTATFNVGVGGGAARSGRTAPSLQIVQNGNVLLVDFFRTLFV